MVLQNKYKARASKRYNAARGGASDGRGRGRGGGRGGMQRRLDPTAFPSLPGQDSEEGEEEEEGDESGESDSSEQKRQRSKYAPRKLTSNSWRYEEPSKETAEGEENAEEEEEPEVDLSGLLERVARLDSSKTSKALSSEQAARNALDTNAADIDASLLYLLDRQKQRDRTAEQDSNDISHSLPRHNLTEEQRKELEREGKRLQEEKVRQEKHQRRARVLQQASAKTISLDIGENRRAKDENVPKPAARGKHSNSTSHLYEDEADFPNQKAGDYDVDAFLSEMNTPSPRVPDISRRAEDVKQLEIAQREKTHKKEQVDEDFLDSIL
ncbi:uncharacterized protein FA14DRAFT_18628 [Meira miltonrushii]|uniref:Uncharacterized protein n=1 Tax=Meira miltonrushii TaxID=1280837 RepID=A0A316VJ92_9BASI|nr:uncharacterized protein FA14DRAFT_18628 [Meira miltonrushii]PWN37747.1 hypothetical protein FA14DRAFT_18628 [Meira miltonrushii]